MQTRLAKRFEELCDARGEQAGQQDIVIRRQNEWIKTVRRQQTENMQWAEAVLESDELNRLTTAQWRELLIRRMELNNGYAEEQEQI